MQSPEVERQPLIVWMRWCGLNSTNSVQSAAACLTLNTLWLPVMLMAVMAQYPRLMKPCMHLLQTHVHEGHPYAALGSSSAPALHQLQRIISHVHCSPPGRKAAII